MATFNTVATQLKTVIGGLSGAPTIDIRKIFVIHPDETFPLCVLSFGGDETDSWGTTGTGQTSDEGTTGLVFHVILNYVADSLGDVESDLATVPDFWQAVKRAVNLGSLSGVASVWNVSIETHESWDHQAFGEGRELSQMSISVHVAEGRNG